MKYKEFLDYLENNLDGYHIFMNKALSYQKEKNAKRPPKSRWNDEKLQKAAYDMWKASMENLYNSIKREVKSEYPAAWTSFMEKNNLFETINDGINDLDFSNEGAA